MKSLKITKTQRWIYSLIFFIITVFIITLLIPNCNNTLQIIIFMICTIIEELILKFLQYKKIIIFS